MENVAGQSQTDILFEFKWTLIRKIDRVNRKEIPGGLHSKILELRNLAQPFLVNEKLEPRDDYARRWLRKWEETKPDNPEELSADVLRRIRWRQHRLLIDLFHRKGAFTTEKIPVDNFEELAP